MSWITSPDEGLENFDINSISPDNITINPEMAPYFCQFIYTPLQPFINRTPIAPPIKEQNTDSEDQNGHFKTKDQALIGPLSSILFEYCSNLRKSNPRKRIGTIFEAFTLNEQRRLLTVFPFSLHKTQKYNTVSLFHTNMSRIWYWPIFD